MSCAAKPTKKKKGIKYEIADVCPPLQQPVSASAHRKIEINILNRSLSILQHTEKQINILNRSLPVLYDINPPRHFLEL